MSKKTVEQIDAETGEIWSSLDQSSISQKTPEFCSYGAPYVAMIADGKSRVFQACCNHWNCAKCRVKLAAQVRQRMVDGSGILSARGLDLYFWTFTCRGRDLDMATADDYYYEWTNRALSRLRAAAIRENLPWIYVQITERQRRGAAHSHFIHSYLPRDAKEAGKHKGHTLYASETFIQAVVAAGLGVQSQITRVETGEAVASYISGYLLKHGGTDAFPPKWKRVRWGREWPDAVVQTSEFLAVMRTRRDWDRADKQGVTFIAENEGIYAVASKHMVHVV
jgi:hypothetical protein